MEEKEEKDVTEESSTPTDPDEGAVDPDEGDGDDKNKNFAKLRKRNKELEEENEELRSKPTPDKDRDLDTKDDEEEEEEEEKESKKSDKVDLFGRDKKKAVRKWNKDNPDVSPELWTKVRGKVKLTGDEMDDEIYDAIDEVYHSLPEVRTKREKRIREEGKKEGMQEFSDEELDIGGGGDADTGGGDAGPRFTGKEKKWMDGLGVPEKDRKNIDKDANTNQYQEGKTPKKKFFEPGK